jgi:hypothetical protein
LFVAVGTQRAAEERAGPPSPTRGVSFSLGFFRADGSVRWRAGEASDPCPRPRPASAFRLLFLIFHSLVARERTRRTRDFGQSVGALRSSCVASSSVHSRVLSLRVRRDGFLWLPSQARVRCIFELYLDQKTKANGKRRSRGQFTYTWTLLSIVGFLTTRT